MDEKSDASIACFFASFLKFLELHHPNLEKDLQDLRQSVTEEDLVRALRVVKALRHDQVPDDDLLFEEAFAYLHPKVTRGPSPDPSYS